MKEEFIIDNAEMARWISNVTGVDEKTVGLILDLELDYLSKMGIAVDEDEAREEHMQRLFDIGEN